MKKQKIFAIILALALMLSAAAAATAASPRVRRRLQPQATQSPDAAQSTPAATSRDDLAAQVVRLVNAERSRQGLGSLRVDPELTRAACVRAGEIIRSFSHTRPDGTSWSTVSARAYGENLARGQNSAEKAMAAWMSSSTGHRENILRPSYGSIGVCVYRYNGALYWVQLFGK